MQHASHLSAELAFADNFASNLPQEARHRWYACRSGHKFQAFFDKKVVAFSLDSGVPKILKVLVCEDFDVSLKKGTSSLWVDEDTRAKLWISHLPVEVAPHCFMWHGQHTTLDLNEYRGRFNVKFNIAYKTEANPATREEGKVYLLEYATFRNLYAQP